MKNVVFASLLLSGMVAVAGRAADVKPAAAPAPAPTAAAAPAPTAAPTAATAAAATPAKAPAPGTPKPPAATAALLLKGEASFGTNCVSCHGESGDGLGPAGPYLSPRPRHFGKDAFKNGNSVEAIFQTLNVGVAGSQMVPFAYLPEDERWGLAYYVLHFVPSADGKKMSDLLVEGKKKAPAATPAP